MGEGFRKLTPRDDLDIAGYKEALDYVFENGDIKNVAISGPYCSGKSSVLESYKKGSNKRFLHVSLANFEMTKCTDNGVKESVLEGKILNQLIYQIDPKEIPQINFRIKRTENKNKVAIKAFFITFLIASFFHIIFWQRWNDIINNYSEPISDRINYIFYKIFEFSTSIVSLSISFSIILVAMGIIVYYIVNRGLNKNLLKSFSFQGNTIELFEKDNDFCFDKYLNEVLYIFENSHADVIVFEDIDRYNSKKVFQSLREVNTLVNSKKQKKPLRFFYLVKDDIFVSKDRTKFFDFIIPIVPVFYSSNSYNMFIEQFKDDHILKDIDEDFLEGISVYVDDMRLLKNICNELIVFIKQIRIAEQIS